MIFFTRDIYLRMQTPSRRPTQAEREWLQQECIYKKYLKLISPRLPPALTRLARAGLHDALVLSARQSQECLVLTIDTSNALGAFRRPRPLKLVFQNVLHRVDNKALRGAWWVQEEVHLSNHRKFTLNVLFHQSELELEADSLRISS